MTDTHLDRLIRALTDYTTAQVQVAKQLDQLTAEVREANARGPWQLCDKLVKSKTIQYAIGAAIIIAAITFAGSAGVRVSLPGFIEQQQEQNHEKAGTDAGVEQLPAGDRVRP